MKIFTILFVIFFLITVNICSYSQTSRHFDTCSCKLGYYEDKDTVIMGDNLKTAPYNMILHFGVKFANEERKHYCTATFISNNTLITSRHCVAPKESIEFIELSLSTTGNDKWIKLTANQFKMYYYKENPVVLTQEDDIALIKIIDKQKLQLLYKNHFNILDTSLCLTEIKDFHLTGFPCTKFSTNKNSHDTMVDRTSMPDSVQVSMNRNFVGFSLSACDGDSGSPLWFKFNNKYNIVAIYRSPNYLAIKGIDKTKNIAVLINDEIKKWIKSICNN